MAVTIGYIFVTQKIIPLKHFGLYVQNNIQIDFNTIKLILEYPKRKFCNFSQKTPKSRKTAFLTLTAPHI